VHIDIMVHQSCCIVPVGCCDVLLGCSVPRRADFPVMPTTDRHCGQICPREKKKNPYNNIITTNQTHNLSSSTVTMTKSSPSPPPNNDHRQNHDNITFNLASTFISVFSILVLHSVCIRPSAATPAPLPSPFIPSSLPATIIPSSHPQQRPFSADVVDKFLTSRCGTCSLDESPAIWSYEGTLTDPMTGKVIADVEGLELIKRLPAVRRSQLTDNNKQSILDNLHAKKLLCSQDSQWDAAMTILSRRLFCYRRRNTMESSPCNSLLTSLRLRPDGPLRHLSPSESMAIYDSALTYISRNKGREMVIISERGGCGGNTEDVEIKNQFVMGHAEINSSNKISPPSIFEFSILARRGSERDGPTQLPLIRSEEVESVDATMSPPRSRFLQFGKGVGSDNSLARKYGSVRETYSYSFNNDIGSAGDASSNSGWFVRTVNQIGNRRLRVTPPESIKQSTLLYTRYGEAPPWYAPGRSCTLELRGERIHEPTSAGGTECTANSSAYSSNLPPLTSWAASKCNFWSGWPTLFSSHKQNTDGVDLMRQYYQLPPESEASLARKAVELFCSERNLSFDQMDNEYPIPERSRWLATSENVLSKVQMCIKRLSKSIV